jgi:hypothetical protein
VVEEAEEAERKLITLEAGRIGKTEGNMISRK